MRRAALLALLAMAGAFGTASAGDAVAAPCWVAAPFGLDMDCYRVEVPAFVEDPSGPVFSLAVAVFPALEPEPRLPPVLMIQGGPGAATFVEAYPEADMTDSWLTSAQDLNRTRDIVLFDARGVGFSTPSADCSEANAQARDNTVPPGSDQPFFTRQAEATRACFRRLTEAGVPFESISTTAMADDIASIARALGYDGIDLWAFSFGTRVALETIRRHPALVHAAVLDSTMRTDGHADEDLPFMTWRSFDRLFADCEAQAPCRRAYPNLRERFIDFVTELNHAPRRLMLVETERWPPGQSVLMSGDDLVFYMYDAFYYADVMPYLPSIIDAALDDPDLFTWFYWYPFLADWSLAEGAFLTVWCRELAPFTDDAVVASEAERYGVLGTAGAAIQTEPACADWPVTPLASDDGRPVTGDLPILFVSGAYDPATPPDWSAEIVKGFPNGVHRVFADGAHSPSGDGGCATFVAIDFLLLASGQPPLRSQGCVGPGMPPSFFVD